MKLNKIFKLLKSNVVISLFSNFKILNFIIFSKLMNTSLNGFSVNILGNVNSFKKDDHNYYALPHMSEYKIKLTNNRPTKCDAQVFIDGESIGIWRINSFDNIILERPANTNRRFIFIKEGSNIAQNAGIYYNQNNGLIKVIFTPERIKYVDKICYTNCDQSYIKESSDNYSTGATILGNNTDQ